MLEKLLGLAMLGSSLANVTLLHRFLSRVVVVVALTIISALFTGVLFLAALYGVYYALTYYGLAPQAAVSLIAIFVVLVTALLIAVMANQLQKIREIPHSLPSSGLPSFSQLGGITEAFIDGLLYHPRGNKTH